MKTKFFFLFVLLFPAYSALAGNPYKELETIDSIKFYYKWRPSNFIKKDSPVRLMLKVENLRNYPVKVTFKVDYFLNNMLQAGTQDSTSLCIKADRKFSGRFRGLGYDVSAFTNEQVTGDNFLIQISELVVEKVCGCEDYQTESAD